MKHIRKGTAPRAHTAWVESQRSNLDAEGKPINLDYKSMPNKPEVLDSLLEEQGFLCCYTGRSIKPINAHIEHFLPQSKCEHYEDVDYQNLLAAFGNNRNDKYGAGIRGDKQPLVDPRQKSCEQAFLFDASGTIVAQDATDAVAKNTIDVLKLNCKMLNDMRSSAIQAALFSNAKPKLTKLELEDIAQAYSNKKNSRNKYYAFCFVIAQVAQQMLKLGEVAKPKRKYQHRAQKSKK